jgi:hypothetical protein
LKSNVLKLVTTNRVHYFSVIADKIEGDDFYVVVPCDKIFKLVSKTTSDHIVLKLNEADKVLEFKGNGNYKLELVVDEEEHLLKFPTYKFNSKATSYPLHLSTVKAVLASNSVSLSKDITNPQYCSYYIAKDAIITTDTLKMCFNDINFLESGEAGDLLLTADTLNLLGLFTDENITVQLSQGNLLFTSPTAVLFIPEDDAANKEAYSIDSIRELINSTEELPSTCSVPKISVLGAIDRLSLFVAPYDENAITIIFTKDGLLLKSKQSNAQELIAFQTSSNFMPCAFTASIEMLKTHVNAFKEELITIKYGSSDLFKLTGEGRVSYILSTIPEDGSVIENGNEEK